MRSDIVPGARFPDYELTHHARVRRRLSELQGSDPMIPHAGARTGLDRLQGQQRLLVLGGPSPEELRQDLREVTRRIRPHWDLAAPGRREQWDAGDRSRHYPYPDPSREPSAQSGAA